MHTYLLKLIKLTTLIINNNLQKKLFVFIPSSVSPAWLKRRGNGVVFWKRTCNRGSQVIHLFLHSKMHMRIYIYGCVVSTFVKSFSAKGIHWLYEIEQAWTWKFVPRNNMKMINTTARRASKIFLLVSDTYIDIYREGFVWNINKRDIKC